LRFSQRWLWRMASSGMLHHVTLVRTDVSEEISASIIRVTRIGELGTLAITNWCMLRSLRRASVASYGYVPSSPILVTLMMEALRSSETLVPTRATRCNLPEDAILQNIYIFHIHWTELSAYQDTLLESRLPTVLMFTQPAGRTLLAFIPSHFHTLFI
jgi:hypothetical protein